MCVVQSFHSFFMNVRSHKLLPVSSFPEYYECKKGTWEDMNPPWCHPLFLASPRLRMSSPIFLASETLKAQVASQQHNFWWCDLFSMKWRSPKVLVEKLYAAKASAKKKCVFFVSCPKSRNKMRSDLRNKVMTYNIRVRLTPINVISSPEIRDNGCE